MDYVRQMLLTLDTSCIQGFLQSSFDFPLGVINASMQCPLSEHPGMLRIWGKLLGFAAMCLN